MATVDHTGNAVRRGYPANSDLSPQFIMWTQLDCAVYNKGSGDIGQMFDVKEGMLVLEVVCEVLTAEGATATMHVGETGGDVDGWITGVNLNSAGWYRSGQAKTASITNANVVMATATQLFGALGGKLYGADDTLDALFNTAGIDVALFNMYAVVFDLKLLTGVVR